MTDQSFAKKFDKTERVLSKRLRAYVKDPTAENVHDLRTAIRRMLSGLNLLPKKLRDKKAMRKLVGRYNKLLRLNAKVRDMDIILAKCSSQQRSEVFGRLVKKLEKSRRSALKPAKRLASDIRDGPGTGVRPSHLSNSKLQNRLAKVAARLSSSIEARLPVVLANPMGKEALHLLREDTRRLRYSLEFGTSTSSLTLFLQRWQNALGTVRDFDVVIEYFQKREKPPDIAAWIEGEMEERNGAYDKFSVLVKERPSFVYPSQSP